MSHLTRSSRIPPIQRYFAMECLEHRIAPATFMVTSFADSGAQTLRDAIEKANASDGLDEIIFMKGGVSKLATSLPDITDDLSISAQKKVTLDGQKTSQIMSIRGVDVDVSISGIQFSRGAAERGGALSVEVEGGTVMLSNVQFTRNVSTVAGGAMAIVSGDVTLQNAVLSGNLVAGSGTSDELHAVRGGAIENHGTLKISDSVFSKNTATGVTAFGGAIANGESGSLELNGATFIQNSAVGIAGAAGANGIKGENGLRGDPGEDGGYGNDGAPGAIGGDGGNAQGGAIYNEGTLSIKGSVLSGNIAVGGAGGKGGNGGKGGKGGAGGSSYRVPEDGRYPGTIYPAGQKGENGYGGAAGDGGIGGSGSGGAVSSTRGMVVIESSSFIKNKASHGKAGKPGAGSLQGNFSANWYYGQSAHGGAIQSIGSEVHISGNSVFLENSALGLDAKGGAISMDSASLTVANTDFLNNTVKGVNGINGASGTAGRNGVRGQPTFDGSDGRAGTAGRDGEDGGDALGGGIYSNSNLTIRNSLISGNIATGGNGGNGGVGGSGGNGGPGGHGAMVRRFISNGSL